MTRVNLRRWLDEVAHPLRRLGLHGTRARRSLWVHGGSLGDFEDAAGLVRDLEQAFPSHRVLFTCPGRATYRTLRARDPGQLAVAAPWPCRPAVHRFLHALDPVALIWLDRHETVPPAVLRAARARAFPIVVARDRPPTWPAVAPALAGVARVPPAGSGLQRRKRPVPLGPIGRWIAAARARRRVGDWEALAARLGHPATILCLGNGPSSEDPAVLAIAHDCLMRVNWRWIHRGVLTRPDVVIVGDPVTVEAVTAPVLAFRTIHKEREALLRHLLRGVGRRAPVHFTLERVSSLLNRPRPATPTGGATMIATAVGLRPRRLVIAGIDLFSDPRGRYPGDTLGRNAYSEHDDREVDLAVIDEALADFTGEVVILAPALEAALRARRAARGERGTQP